MTLIQKLTFLIQTMVITNHSFPCPPVLLGDGRNNRGIIDPRKCISGISEEQTALGTLSSGPASTPNFISL